jgi:hypothetical protein
MPGTVTVACKIPNGIFIRSFEMMTEQETIPNGTREVKVARNVGEPIKINGPGRLDLAGDRRPMAGAFALTYNVDADSFERWMAANKDTPMVQNRLIFCHAKTDSVASMAREAEGQLTGLEPMDTQGDKRISKNRTNTRGGAVSGIETAKRAA